MPLLWLLRRLFNKGIVRRSIPIEDDGSLREKLMRLRDERGLDLVERMRRARIRAEEVLRGIDDEPEGGGA